MQTRVLTSPHEVRWFTQDLRRRGQRLALVPTMGFLHEGHLSLMREGAARCDVVAATIFVNPTQFGPNEDLSRYPRDLTGDVAKCASAGAAVVYAPTPEAVYPKGFQTTVSVERVSQGLCGARRPGHFAGVATVVTKLLALFRPDLALFGEKDYQQLKVIAALTTDLDLGVEIVGVPTVREADGLAMSSRNTYLSADERGRALALSKALTAMQGAVAAGERRAEALVAVGRGIVEASARLDYLEVRDAQTLEPVSELEPGRPARGLVAAFVGATRLIDNMPLVVP